MRWPLLLTMVLAACNSEDGGAVPDAPAAAADAATIKDAPFVCTPVAPVAPGPACLALASSTLQGTTPFGMVDVELDSFAAGDCITISHAAITWRGACGELLRVQFSYPVHVTESGRRAVTGSFDRNARFVFEPPGLAQREHVAAIHVDVTQWQEGQDLHDIDITLTVTDAAYALPPLRIAGTFCDWPNLLC